MKNNFHFTQLCIRYLKEMNLSTPFLAYFKQHYQSHNDVMKKYGVSHILLTPRIVQNILQAFLVGRKNIILEQLKQLSKFDTCLSNALNQYKEKLILEFLESDSPLLDSFKHNLYTHPFGHQFTTVDEYVTWLQNTNRMKSFFSSAFSWVFSSEGFSFWEEKSQLLFDCEKFW